MKQRMTALILALCMLLTMAPHAEASSQPEPSTLNIIQPTVGGTISADKTVAAYGESIHVTAIPYEGYHFVQWTGNYSGTNANLIIVMHSGNSSISATFEPHSYGPWQPVGSLEVHKRMCTCQDVQEQPHAFVNDTCTECTMTREHVHSWGDWIANGDGTHNRACQSDATHTETERCAGGIATCTHRAQCRACGAAYGSVDPAHHAGHDEAWSYDDQSHMLKCLGCGNAMDSATIGKHAYASDTALECDVCGYVRTLHTHHYAIATCTTPATCACGAATGSVDMANHVGGTEIRGAKAAAEFEAGYTGDTYCLGCGSMLSAGSAIPQTHVHHYATRAFDREGHWWACACGDATAPEEHEWYIHQKDANMHYWRCGCGNSGWGSSHREGGRHDGLCDDCGESMLKTYTITYDANGGEGFMSSQTFTEGAEQGLHENGFTREGHEFIGWTDGSNVYSDGEHILAVADTVMSAMWHQHNYSNWIPLNESMHYRNCSAADCQNGVLVEYHDNLMDDEPCSVCHYGGELHIDAQFHDSTTVSLKTTVPVDQVVADHAYVTITREGDSGQSWMAENLNLSGRYTFTATAGDQTASVTVDAPSLSFSFNVTTPDGESVNVLVNEPEGEIIDGTVVDTVTEEEITELLNLAEAQDSDLILINYSPLEAINGASVLINREALESFASAARLDAAFSPYLSIAASSAMAVLDPSVNYPVIDDDHEGLKIVLTSTRNSKGAEISAGGEILYRATVTTENLEEDSQVTLILCPDQEMNSGNEQLHRGWLTEGWIAYCTNLGIIRGRNSDTPTPWEPHAISAVDSARYILLAIGYGINQNPYTGVLYETIDLVPGSDATDDEDEVPKVKLRLSSKFIQDHLINDMIKGYDPLDDGSSYQTPASVSFSHFLPEGVLTEWLNLSKKDYSYSGYDTAMMLEWFKEFVHAEWLNLSEIGYSYSGYGAAMMQEWFKEFANVIASSSPPKEDWKQIMKEIQNSGIRSKNEILNEEMGELLRRWEKDREKRKAKTRTKEEITSDGIQFTISFENSSENDSDSADDRFFWANFWVNQDLLQGDGLYNNIDIGEGLTWEESEELESAEAMKAP